MFSMVNHTLTLKQLLDSGVDIGLKDYPIWDESYRTKLNDFIINHFYLREIGQETPALFIHYLNMTMNEIMPYYVKLYNTTQFDYNPLNSADYTIEYTKTNKGKHNSVASGTSNSTSSGESTSQSSSTNVSTNENTTSTNGKNARVDTPQGVIDVVDVDNLNYATEVNLAKQQGTETISGNATATGNDSSNNSSVVDNTMNNTVNNENDDTETFSQHLVGDYGVKSTQALIKEEREIIVNIVPMIIKELESCFMLVF